MHKTNEKPQPINTHLYPSNTTNQTKTVWVVGCESLTSGSFDWHPNKQDAIEQFNADKIMIAKLPQSQLHLFCFEVESDLTNEQVTQEVDNFYATEAQSLIFNSSELVECFPFNAQGWDFIVKEYHGADKVDSKITAALTKATKISLDKKQYFYSIDGLNETACDRYSEEPCVYALTETGNECEFTFNELVQAHANSRLIFKGEHIVEV
ncbi:hypothetical protein AB4254_10940 [Vibrio breoganii]